MVRFRVSFRDSNGVFVSGLVSNPIEMVMAHVRYCGNVSNCSIVRVL